LEITARPLRKLRVKGRQQEFMVYELLGMREANDLELAARVEDAELCELTEAASAHFERSEFAQAAVAYRKVLERFPNDRLAQVMLKNIPASEFA
jgi:hypothetical protein